MDISKYLTNKDKDKFQAFKEKAVKKNEEMYGAEARKKYGDAWPRRTEITTFDTMTRAEAAVENETLYIDEEGFRKGGQHTRRLCGCTGDWR